MRKVLILGSSGMLGHMVYYHLVRLNKYQVIDVSFSNKLHEKSILLDVTNSSKLTNLISHEEPDVIVNCIGILIKGSQKDILNAIYVNSYFPHQLVKILRKIGKGKLIHISTDCVFSGNKGMYSEIDFRDADDIYGRSKALGEILNEIDVTLRTSIVGPELKLNGEGLFHWFMMQSGQIKGYVKDFWGGVTTLELAKVIEIMIDQDKQGLFNITNGCQISKFELLKLFQKEFNIHTIDIIKGEGKNTNKSLISIRDDLNFQISSYDKMIQDLRNYMDENKSLYKFYKY